MLKSTFALLGTLLISVTAYAQTPPKVVTTIAPIHSLVNSVMGTDKNIELLITGAGSPHDFHLKPSQLQAIENADLIFWIGEDLETFMEKIIGSLKNADKAIELSSAHGLVRRKFEEEHDHEEEHAKHEDHDHSEHAEHEDHDEHEGHDHHHGEFDPHFWLDPVNAKAFVHEIEEALIKADPANKATYEANVEKTMQKLNQLNHDIEHKLEAVEKRPFLAFHDAYGYFTKRYHLAYKGALTVSPTVLPSAKKLKELQHEIEEEKVVCVFSEPQFNNKTVNVVIEGTRAKAAQLDPLGGNLQPGRELYFSLMKNISDTMYNCLK